jgi:hypothetical protein
MIAGCNGIAGLPPEVVGPRGRYLTGLVEPCEALPRKCLFIYLFENVRFSKSDSEERQSKTLRDIGIVGARKLLIEGREVKWQDLESGDVISVERITDASAWVKVGNRNDAKEFRYLSSDLTSAGKMVQNYWPNQQLFRRFGRAHPSTWSPGETSWILPLNQWHLCVKFEGTMRQIAFTSEDHFFRQAKSWANGLVNIVDENGQEVLLQDTVDTESMEQMPDSGEMLGKWSMPGNCAFWKEAALSRRIKRNRRKSIS